MSESLIIRLLFALRGMPARMTSFKGLHDGRFIKLEQKENQELIIGLIGQFWKPNGNLQKFESEDFIPWYTPGYLKAIWNFELIQTNSSTQVITETRIMCLGDDALRNFRRYWFFIRPFSGLIRKEILRGMRKKAMKNESREDVQTK
jgi:hypothetical protein